MFEGQNQPTRSQSSENQTASPVILGSGLAAGESRIILMAGLQSLPLTELSNFYRQVGAIAKALGRELI